MSDIPQHPFGDRSRRPEPYLTFERQARQEAASASRKARGESGEPLGQGRGLASKMRQLVAEAAAPKKPEFKIQEERLRSTAGLRGSPALALSAWRGRSGRRYVVRVNDLTEAALADAGREAVVVAVRRDENGIPMLIGATVAAAITDPVGWLSLAKVYGGNELHAHGLADGEAERRAMVSDLDETARPSLLSVEG